MLFRHLTTASLFTALAAAGTSSVDACTLTDRLFGRQVAVVPTSTVPVVAGTPVGQPFAAGFAPSATALPTTTTAFSSGAFQAQRPAYVNNPSVFTGAPIGTTAQTAFSVPITGTPLTNSNLQTAFSAPVTSARPLLSTALPLRGRFARSGSQQAFLGGTQFGAVNVYPNSSFFPSTVSAARPVLSPTVVPTTNVAPLFPNAPRTPIRSGLSRFFGRLFNTNFQSSFVQTPTTVFRPVTTVDPVLGTTVTVQQPCTSTVQQLQRTPFSTLRPVAAAPIQVAPSFGTPTCPTSAFGQTVPGTQLGTQLGTQFGMQPGMQSGAIGQVGAVGVTPGQFTTPIPSTAMPPASMGQGGFQAQPNTAPLSGSPTNPRSQSDQSPMQQPSLNSFRQQNETSFRDSAPAFDSPAESAKPAAEPTMQKSFWELQNSEDSTAMISPSRRYGAVRPNFETRQQAPSFTGVQPIRALQDDEPSPFRRELSQPTHEPVYDTPQLPARTAPVGGFTSNSRVPVREAALTRRSYRSAKPLAPLAPAKRDNTWTKAK